MHDFFIAMSYWVHQSFTVTTLTLISVLILAFMYIKKEWAYIYAFIVGLLATIGSVYVLKNIFKVPRPSNAYVIETGYAMPSGHASLGFFLAVFLIYYIVKKPGNSFRETIGWIILGAFAIIIAASRVFLNVHTINQVTIGAIIGTAIALLAILYTRRKKI